MPESQDPARGARLTATLVDDGLSDGDADELTFVFTDIEGSTRLLERLRGAYGDVLARHGEIIRDALVRHGGREVDTQGDAFFAVFADPASAVVFASDVQRRLVAEPWPRDVQVRIRIGLHRGRASLHGTRYVGLDVHHAARVAAAGHGGQVLMSGQTSEVLPERLGDGIALRALGAYRLKDVREPMELVQLDVDGLAQEFPPPRSLDEPEPPPTVGDAPYLGLAQFEEDDVDRFFGREVLTEELVARLDREPFLALIGASGSGKSSMVRAGVIPTIRGRTPSRRIVTLTPTDLPVASLESALGDHGSHEAWLIVVDQFEELYTLCRDEAQRTEFIGRLLARLDAGTRLIVVLRADFYDRLAGYDRLREMASEHQAYLGPLHPDDLRRAIEGPAHQGGWRLAPGLVDLILHDVGREPGALPLLSHALHETWQRRRGDQLTLRGYLDSGGVQGAIARTADETLAGLDGSQVLVARDIFLRLTELGEDTPDTRRRASLRELVEQQQDPSTARAVLDRLVSARLVVTEGADAEVAHEALIREWPTLREWLEDDRDALRFHRLLADAARDWDASARDPGLLLRGPRLARAVEWGADQRSANLLERDLIAASQAAALAEADEREAQRRRELEAAHRLAETERTAARRLRRRAILLAGAVIAALGLAALAVIQLQRADEAAVDAQDQATLARGRQLAAAADSVLQRDPELGLILAIEAVEGMRNEETDAALRRAAAASLVRTRHQGHDDEVVSVALDETGEVLLSAASDGIRLRRADGTDEVTLATGDEHPSAAQLSADGRVVATLTDNGRLWAWDAATGEEHFHVDAHDVAGASISISADGTRIATTADDGRIVIWDGADGEVVRELVNDPYAITTAVDFSSDGALIVTGGPEQFLATVWEVASGERVVDLVGHTDWVIDAAFAPDGSRIVTVGQDETVRLWDTATGAMTGTLRGHDGAITSVAFAGPDLVVTGSEDATAAVWNVGSRTRIARLAGHAGPVTAVAGHPYGTHVTTGGADGTVRTWAVSGQPASVTMTGFVAAVQDAAISPDGSRAVGTASDFTAQIFDAASGEALHVLDHGGFVVSAAFTADGDRVVTACVDGLARIWDVETGELLVTMEGHEGVVWTSAFDPAGARVVTVGVDGTARIWLGEDGSEQLQFEIGPTETAAAAIFTSDGRGVLTGDAAGVIALWDAESGERVGTFDGHTDGVSSLALSVDGDRMVSASNDGSVRTWDVGSRRELLELRGDFGNPHKARFSPDAGLVISGGDDGAAHVWSTATGALLASIASDERDVMAASFLPDGEHVLLGNRGSSLTIHRCDLCAATEDVLTLARARVTRELTSRERAAYLDESGEVAASSASPGPTTGPAVGVGVGGGGPAASPVAGDDICAVIHGPCELAAGEYRPSLFSIPIQVRLDEPATGFGQSRAMVGIDLPGGQIIILAGDYVLGYQGDSMIRVGPRGSDFIDFLNSRPWYELGPVADRVVGGLEGFGVAIDTSSALTDVLDLYFAEPVPFGSFPGERWRAVVVDVDDTYLAITGSSFDPASEDEFVAEFEAFVGRVSFEP